LGFFRGQRTKFQFSKTSGDRNNPYLLRVTGPSLPLLPPPLLLLRRLLLRPPLLLLPPLLLPTPLLPLLPLLLLLLQLPTKTRA